MSKFPLGDIKNYEQKLKGMQHFTYLQIVENLFWAKCIWNTLWYVIFTTLLYKTCGNTIWTIYMAMHSYFLNFNNKFQRRNKNWYKKCWICYFFVNYFHTYNEVLNLVIFIFFFNQSNILNEYFFFKYRFLFVLKVPKLYC